MMTTAATVMGHLRWCSRVSRRRNSIGIMLVTGMIIGTCFT
jgi:multidrug efflux pump subunit AcrB